MSWYKKASLYYDFGMHKTAAYEDEYQSRVENLATQNPYPFKHLFTDGGSRIYFPFQLQNEDFADKDVKDILEGNGFTITDYRGGYCSDGRNTLKIGKVLNKLWQKDIREIQEKFERDEIYNLEREVEAMNKYYEEVINTFQNSSARSSKKSSGLSVVISQDPNDVAKMSTDRDWTSCMDLSGGQHSSDVFCEVQEGGLVAYLVNEGDTDIQKPLARIRIRRFSDDDGRSIMAAEEAIYGNEVEGFQKFVKDWIKSAQGDVAEGLYYLKGGQYSDTFNSSMFVMPTNEEDVLRLWREEVDDSKFIKYKVINEFVDEDDEYFSDPSAPQYFGTKEEALQYIDSLEENEEYREMMGGYWLEKDEDGDWTYDQYDVRKEQTMTKKSLKDQAAVIIVNSPKGEYSMDVIKDVKDWAFQDRSYSSTYTIPTIKRLVLDQMFEKYPEILTYEEAQMDGPAKEYDFVKNMEDGPEKDAIKQNIMHSVKNRISDLKALYMGNSTVKTPDLRMSVNFAQYVSDPIEALFSPIPADVTNSLIQMAQKLNSNEPMGFGDIPDEILDPMYIQDKSKIEESFTEDVRLELAKRIVWLFESTKTDTPEVQRLYQSLLPKWGHNRKQQGFEHVYPPYSPVNIDSLGRALGALGENGQQFLPFLKDKLAEERVILEKTKENQNTYAFYGKYIEKNIEKYLYVIDSIENKTGYSSKYKFFSSNNWYKFSQIVKPYKYLGQCDRLRCNKPGEDNWQNMIANHQKVSQEEFESNCDFAAIVDDDEDNLSEFVADDQSSYFAKSVWGGEPCYYVMTSGFEFIFVRL